MYKLKCQGLAALFAGVGSIAAADGWSLNADLSVLRLSETHRMVFTPDRGPTAGIDTSVKRARLPGGIAISLASMRIVADADTKQRKAIPTAATTTQGSLSGDPDAGQKVFRKCKACHSLQEGKNGVGPSLHGIMGASAGAVDGFRYSNAMKDSGITWNAETLAGYLADPKGYVPGNKMAFRGLRKDAEIENVIAYLGENG